MFNNSGLEFSNFLVILNLFQDLVFIFPDITETISSKRGIGRSRRLPFIPPLEKGGFGGIYLFHFRHLSL